MTSALLQQLQESLGRDLQAFVPELILCVAIVGLLLIRLFPMFDRHHLGWVALVAMVAAFFASLYQWRHAMYDPRDLQNGVISIDLFGGMLVFDNFTIYLKLFLFGFTALTIFLSMLTGIPDRDDSADYFCLLLGATLGMSIMASANHLLMVFMGVEMASVPSYALAGFLKGRRQGSEAALKYVVYGGGAAGIMLYGISLIAGRFGTGYLPDVTYFITQSPIDVTTILGVFFILVGVGFKLAAFPFHFWCPDVFEGASAEVAAFLSVASKGAALAMLARITLGLAGLTANEGGFENWQRASELLIPPLAILAVLTTTFGNLAAYGQTNLKRLLAYSTIAHAGFMMMGLCTMTREGVGAVLFYLAIYLFMNLGAFTVVAFLRNLTGSEDLRDFRGMIYLAPVLVVTLGVFLLSLLGLPPLSGFMAKFQILSALFDGAQHFQAAERPALANTLYAVIVAGGLNTVLSLVYYVRVLKVMVLEKTLEEVEGQPVRTFQIPWIHASYVSGLALVVVALGVFWNSLANASNEKGVNIFHRVPAPNGQHAHH